MDDPADAEAENFWRMILKLRLVPTANATARSTTEIADAARHQIDTELRAMQRIISLACTRRNDMALTARFPAEVLAHIFTTLSQCDTPSATRLLTPDGMPYRPHNLGWITVTHVCSLWRQLALSTPALWSNIGAPHTAFWINKMLERSKKVPFHLAIEIGLQNSSDVNDAILNAVGPNHVSRLKTLYVAAEKGEHDSEDVGEEDSEDGSGEGSEDGNEEDSEDGNEEISDFTLQVLQGFKLPAPLVESIRFNATDFAQPIPSDIFASALPRLREVIYGRCKNVPWTAGFFCNLTALDLQLPARESSSTLIGLLSLLEQSPGLVKLLLVDSEPNHSIGALRPPPGRCVSLPCLQYFYLFSTHGFTFTGLLAALDVGSSADVVIDGVCRDDPGGIRDFMVLAAKLPSRGDINACQPSALSLRLACNKKADEVHIDIKISGLSRDDRLFCLRPQVQQTAWTSWIPALFHYFDFRFITALEFSGDSIPPSDILIQMLALMDGLSKLVLHNFKNLAAREFIPLLRPGMVDINSGGSDPRNQQLPLLLPKLSHLTLNYVYLNTMTIVDPQTRREVFAKVLLDVVRQRSLLGRRLVLLTLSNCTHSFINPQLVFEEYKKHVDRFLLQDD